MPQRQQLHIDVPNRSAAESPAIIWVTLSMFVRCAVIYALTVAFRTQFLYAKTLQCCSRHARGYGEMRIYKSGVWREQGDGMRRCSTIFHSRESRLVGSRSLLYNSLVCMCAACPVSFLLSVAALASARTTAFTSTAFSPPLPDGFAESINILFLISVHQIKLGSVMRV